MRKNDAFRRAAALMAALSITVSLAAPAFAATSRTYYIDYGDITITKDEHGKQTVKQGDSEAEKIGDDDEIIITTFDKAGTTLESDLEGPAAEDSGFGPVVEDNYQQEDAEESEDDDRQESAKESKDDDQKNAEESENDGQKNAEESENDDQKNAEESENDEEQKDADRQAQPQQAAPAPAAAPAASTPVHKKENGFWGNTITVINNFANTVLNLTLKDVKIDVSDTGDVNHYGPDQRGKAALSVQGSGDVEIELDGKNELKSGAHRAGLDKNTFDSTGTLTLKDDNKEAGSLKATGGVNGGAGIGGSYGEGTKNITITGGTVNAAGDWGGAGIGGGQEGSGEDITITGGTVNATGGYNGAGIGGGIGEYGNGKNIKITGGTVNATGGISGAGIGGGYGGSGEDITINGGTVTAVGDDWGAGIGGGSNGSGKNITITGGTVTATGGVLGAGIGGGGGGGGFYGNGENITITGGTVNASGCAGAGIGGGINGSGSNVTVSRAAQVTVTASKSSDWNSADTGATIGNGGSVTEDGDLVDGKEIQADISGLTTGYIRHIIYNLDGSIKREWWEYGHLQPAPEGPNAPAEESNEVSLGTPGLHVETLEGSLLPFDARRQGSTLRVTSNTLAARLHGTRQALEALREQGVEQIQFVTSFKTTTLSVEDLLAEGGSWFALEHNGLVSRQLSAAQAESLKCQMR